MLAVKTFIARCSLWLTISLACGCNGITQGFVFSTVRDLQYGLVQHQGGPCGILAVVQGYVLRFLLQHAPVDWKNVSISFL